MRNRLFFVISGEHRTLPHAEIRAILQGHHVDFVQVAASAKLLRVEADSSALDVVAKRSMMFEQCGVEIAATRPSSRQLLAMIKELDLPQRLRERRSFAVRSLRIGRAFRRIQRATLEREIGDALRREYPNLKVDLDRPDVTFLCIVYPHGLLLGEVTHSRAPGLIASRRPRKRPVFHPSTMPPKLARCLVNLARPPRGGILLDPFCGVGGILLEAATIDCNAVGADADPKMVRGARANLKHYGAKPLGLVVEDATRMCVRSVHSIATDPPYGRESSTRGQKLDRLLREFLPAAHDALSEAGHLCICCPSEMRLASIAKATGFIPIESHLAYVHRSLTRRILVLKKI